MQPKKWHQCLVVYRHLEVVVDTLKEAHIFALRTYNSVWYEGNRVISVRGARFVGRQ